MAMKLLTTNSGSGQSTSSFTSSIDSTYKLYIFKFISLNPSSNTTLTFQANAAAASGYNETITSTAFRALQNEAGNDTGLAYQTGEDQAQGTAFQSLGTELANDADGGGCGTLWLFNPSNTTYVKHWYSRITNMADDGSIDYANDSFRGGYINTTAAIDDIQFKFLSGTFDGTIKMYGVG